jgi:hypothetical protein
MDKPPDDPRDGKDGEKKANPKMYDIRDVARFFRIIQQVLREGGEAESILFVMAHGCEEEVKKLEEEIRKLRESE